MKHIDERDTIFSRMNLVAGTPSYKEYYQAHPEHEERDQQVRQIPFKNLFVQKPNHDSSGASSGKLLALRRIVKDNWRLIDTYRVMAEEYEISEPRVEVAPEEITPLIKEVTRYHGADLVGVIEMQDHHFYTHHGFNRGANYSQPVDRSLKYAIVFAVEMNREMINRAPHLEQMLATNRGYYNATLVGLGLTCYLKGMGYKAFLNTVMYYNAPMTPLARDAGLGQIGRHGMLITKEYGPRVRLGAVITDLQLITDDKPVDYGLTEFCKRCKKCATNCIGKAISHEDPRNVEGQQRWEFNDTNCMKIWHRVGTDCGICLSSCPFSQGVEADLFDKIKDNPEVINQILSEHDRKYGKRAYLKDKLPIVDL